MLCRAEWYFVTGGSGQTICPIFKVQAVLDLLDPLKMGSLGCSETSTTDYRYTLFNIPEERKSHLHCVESLKSHKSYSTSNMYFFLAFPNGCATHVVGFCGTYF
jgi:hypothetical protein